ncbi:MAG: hypothetical protein IKV03_04390 [Alphaproteobacteria bacterium]|nr:hypothetical protein [Alphaproteobacteria bacterium]
MDNQFKAPPVPPKAPTPVFMPKEHPQESTTKGLYDDNFAVDFNLPAKFLTTKVMAMVLGGALLLGVLFGATFLGGERAPQQQAPTKGSINGVVPNIDLTVSLPRCGIAERGKSCLLYVQNSSRYDKMVEDFFDNAGSLMGRTSHSIAMVNSRYAKQRIKPGYIAQIKIPDL